MDIKFGTSPVQNTIEIRFRLLENIVRTGFVVL